MTKEKANTIFRRDIEKEIADSVGIPPALAARALNVALGCISSSVREGKAVSIKDFGRFESVERRARKARNLKTGETVELPARRVPKFKAYGQMKNLPLTE